MAGRDPHRRDVILQIDALDFNQMTIHEYIDQTPLKGRFVLPSITCADGFMLSVQASTLHASRREAGVVTHVEVGRPDPRNEIPEEWSEYEDPTGPIWTYVPIGLVQKLIDDHGGILVLD